MNKHINFSKLPLFISIIFFCISLIVFLFFYGAINNRNRELLSREMEWQDEEFRRNEIKAFERSVKMIEEERVELETHFAQSSDIVPFLDTIEGLAFKAGAQAEVTSVDVLKDNNGLMVSMKASGTFNGLYKFLTLLENSQYELEFAGLAMSRKTASNAESKNIKLPQWDAVFKIKLLSFIE